MKSIIRVVMIIVRVIRNSPLFVIQLITNHLGRNPMNGGRPPRDIKLIMKDNLFSLVFLA